MDLQKKVKNQVAIGVLIGGMCIALILWYLAYTQQRVDAFSNLTIPSEYWE